MKFTPISLDQVPHQSPAPKPELSITELLRLVVWLGLLGVVFIQLERLFPLKRAPILRPQYRADLAYYFINGLLPRLLLIILVAEVGGYWGHRLSHEVPWPWRFHAVHHSVAHIDWLVKSRGHPFDIAFGRFSALLPVYVVGLARPSGASAD